MKKILIGLSGGVDSAVAAHLLMKEGYDVTAGFMKNYISETGNCTTYQDAEEAIKVANFLGIKILSFDLIKEYEEKIIKYIYEGYSSGITPNPDILCNSLIKFDVFLDHAIKLGFDKIATGHYARIIETENTDTNKSTIGLNYRLFRGTDHNKDQSYFLSGLNQFQLSKSIFPIGEMNKVEIRKIAKEIGLPNAERKDSQGLCFIGNIPIKSFLEQRLPKKEGNIIDENGNIVGKHPGAYFFTIGQRHGLNLNFKSYVINTNVKDNTVTIGDKDAENLSSSSLDTNNRNRIANEYKLPLTVKTKIRYRQEPEESILQEINGNKMTIKFMYPQRAIAPGQTVVAYLGEECIGSGIIGTRK